MLAACQRQLDEHWASLWSGGHIAIQMVAKPEDAVGTDYALMSILDDADQEGALGYHDLQGRPFGRVFAKTVMSNGGSLMTGSMSVSVTLSHEILELVGDPGANQWGDGPGGIEFAMELCDAVEDDAYVIDGVAVSDFLGPNYFEEGAPGPYDQLGLLKQPFQPPRAGGYEILRTSATDIHNITARGEGDVRIMGSASGAARIVRFTPEYPAWKKEMKLHEASRAHRREARR